MGVERKDPYIVFNFGVTFIGFGAIIQGGFSEVTGLQGEMDVHEYDEGGENDFKHKLPGPVRYTSNLVLKRGMVDRNLWIWFETMGLGLPYLPRFLFRSIVEIKMEDWTGEEQSWIFLNAYPVKWIGPQMNAKQSEVAVETLELAHQGILI
ncbi:MAG: phage tail protein [bacterium]